MPQPLVWQRRQIPSQQVTIGPTLMEGVERINAVMVRGQGQGMGAPRRDSYAMEVDRERNCYTCGGFGHMACHYRNQKRGRVAEERRLEYEGRKERLYEYENHLKEKENLETLD